MTLIEEHSGVGVVRDDLFPGGTKARFVPKLFEGTNELVYASPAQGGAQYAIAYVARQLGKRATIFVADRRIPHPRQIEAKHLGAKIVFVKNGYLNVVQARARDYAREVGARLAPFGMDAPEAIEMISAAARDLHETPDEVWCAAGSGTLTRALQAAWPRARHFAVAYGRDIPPELVGSALQIRHPLRFEKHAKTVPPFPCDPHCDAKAWEIMLIRRTKKTARERAGRCLFWNVVAPAILPQAQ
jgi:Pyridoxal-phosphate dependent enzyme